jgi:beta-glucanase (GH16 family)
MFSKSAILAIAAASLASAQTSTLCQPLEKTCPADPAFGNKKISCDLTKGPCDSFFELDGTKLAYDERGAIFSIKEATNAPTVSTHKYIFFGRVDVELQAAAGGGIVTSLVLQSDDLDEIDLEWVGGDDAQVQSNYFYKGDDTVFDRGAFHPIANAVTQVHKYSMEYTPKAVTWYVDDKVVRVLTYEEVGAAKFPQTPMQIKMGTWCGGCKGQPKGTVEWSKGPTNMDDAPFDAIYKSISIIDYAGGSGPTSESIKEYVYGDKSGNWESIKVIKGDGSSDDDKASSSSTSVKPTKSADHESHSSKPTKSAESTKSAEETKSEDKTSSAKPTPSSTFLTTSSEPATTPAPSSTTGEDGATTPAPSTSGLPDAPGAASGLSLGSALAVGAGLLIAQLLL